MPIEIRELVIKATIEEPSQAKGTSAPSASSREDRQGIVADCVEQVMEILRNRAER